MANAEHTTSPPVRWTHANIRKATLCPKPKGAVQAYQESIAARGEPIGRLLAHILEHADIIDDGRRLDHDGVKFTHTGAWLLVSLPGDLLDYLLAIGVEQADLEPDPDIEPDQDAEPSLGAPEAVSQIASWGRDHTGFVAVDVEDDQICEGTGDEEPSDSDEGSEVRPAGSAPDWQPWTFPASEADGTTLGEYQRL